MRNETGEEKKLRGILRGGIIVVLCRIFALMLAGVSFSGAEIANYTVGLRQAEQCGLQVGVRVAPFKSATSTQNRFHYCLQI